MAEAHSDTLVRRMLALSDEYGSEEFTRVAARLLDPRHLSVDALSSLAQGTASALMTKMEAARGALEFAQTRLPADDPFAGRYVRETLNVLSGGPRSDAH